MNCKNQLLAFNLDIRSIIIMQTSDYISMISAAIAAGSAIFSLFAIYIPWRNTHDSEIFKEAVRALERSYSVLTDQGKEESPPPPDRLNWLTAARHIEAYKSLKCLLKSNLYATLCRENEEYWRHQFYLAMLRNSSYTVSYYERGQIEPRSALVLYSFASWPRDKSDPIDSVDFKALFLECEQMQTNIGFKEYLKKFPKYTVET